MKTHRINLLIFGLFFSLNIQLSAGEDKHQSVPELMKEEYVAVAGMRHKLKELMERQELEEVLQEGNDAYTSFQNLEQWMRQMESKPGSQEMQALMAALKEFENHLSRVLKQQETLSEQLPFNSPNTQNREEIPLSELMKKMQELIKNGKFQEARQMLNEMLNAFNLQQQQLQQSIAQYNQEKFSEISRQLKELHEKASNASLQEKQVSALLQQFLKSFELPPDTRKQADSPQSRITQLTEEMQEVLEQMEASPLLPMKELDTLIDKSRTSSRQTSREIASGTPQEAFRAAEQTQSGLAQIRGKIAGMQQQIQQLSQAQPAQPGRNGPTGRNYWSEKGVRPPKFEYGFQANPAYRDEIQELNQKKHLQITPRQQEYLQGVIK
ncbi:MAG: hypothetical protein HQM13_04235 [SAR324 cluster bacterium]|nr:hypothetical protein [SAR324 cluster bacterium]